jgi:hypothetical protein
MPYFNWVERARELSAAALTVRAQLVSPNDNGRLIWDAFMPRQNVDSNKINVLFGQRDLRYVSDRREWNVRGRQIPIGTPSTEQLTFTPIESYFKLGEEEIYDLETATRGNEALFRQIVGGDIPPRIDGLAQANYRRIEVDFATAWALGQIEAKNPSNGQVLTVALPFDAARWDTAGTAWDDAGVNAYNEFLAWYQDARDMTGDSGQGVLTRSAVIREIQKDAPNPFVPAGVPILLTRGQLEARISDEIGAPFRFYEYELSLDLFADGSTNSTRTKVWPAGRIAFVPSGEQVGVTAFAPVVRAMEAARTERDAGIDIRGMTAYTEVANGGRELTVEVEAIAIPVPNEQLVSVMNTGIAA